MRITTGTSDLGDLFAVNPIRRSLTTILVSLAIMLLPAIFLDGGAEALLHRKHPGSRRPALLGNAREFAPVELHHRWIVGGGKLVGHGLRGLTHAHQLGSRHLVELHALGLQFAD